MLTNTEIQLEEESRKYVTQYSQGAFPVHPVTFWCGFCSSSVPADNGEPPERTQ